MNHSFSLIVLLSCHCLFINDAAAQLNNYDAGGRKKVIGSYGRLMIEPLPATLRSPDESAASIVGPLLPPAIDLGVSLVNQWLGHGAKNYESVFTVNASASGFWISETQVNLPMLVITRTVLRKGHNTVEEAFRLRLTPQLSADSTAFRLVLLDPFMYTYSSAKTKGDHDLINIDLVIRMQALTIDEGKYKLVEMRSTTLSIPMVTTGSEYKPSGAAISSGWLPFPPMPSFQVQTDVATETLKTVATHGTNNGRPDNDTLTTLTRTVSPNGSSVQFITEKAGLYEFGIEVHESNPFRVRAIIHQDVFDGIQKQLSELLKAAVGD